MSLFLFLCLATLGIGAAVAGIRRIPNGVARRLVYVLGAIVVIPALVALGWFSARVVNNWRLAQFSRQLFEFPLPHETREVGRSTAVGVLVGNGNHCDFVATRDVASTLPLDTLKAHFASLRLRPAISGGTSGDPPSIEVRQESAGNYTVVAVDAPYEGSFDPRCQ